LGKKCYPVEGVRRNICEAKRQSKEEMRRKGGAEGVFLAWESGLGDRGARRKGARLWLSTRGTKGSERTERMKNPTGGRGRTRR